MLIWVIFVHSAFKPYVVTLNETVQMARGKGGGGGGGGGNEK